MKSPFFAKLAAEVAALGGYHNAHLHLDRAYAPDDGYVDGGRIAVLESSHISLQKNHALIRTVDESRAYDADDLGRRVHAAVDRLIAVNTRIADTMVDVTPDRVGTETLTDFSVGGEAC